MMCVDCMVGRSAHEPPRAQRTSSLKGGLLQPLVRKSVGNATVAVEDICDTDCEHGPVHDPDLHLPRHKWEAQ